MPNTAITIPQAADTYINKENSFLALSKSPSPMVFEMSALPPVPNIKPMEPRIIRNGMMKLTAAKGVLPTKFETKNPSTTP